MFRFRGKPKGSSSVVGGPEIDFETHPNQCHATPQMPPKLRLLLLSQINQSLGPQVVPFYPFLGEGSRTKKDYRNIRVPPR